MDLPTDMRPLSVGGTNTGARIARLLDRSLVRGGIVADYWRYLGVIAGSRYAMLDRRNGRREMTVEWRSTRTQLRVRVGHRYRDLRTVFSVFGREEYASPLPSAPQTVVDLGANIGTAAIWFSTRYPDATIIAVEPEAQNFELLVKNCASRNRIIPVRAAVSDTSGPLSLRNRRASSDAYRTWGGIDDLECDADSLEGLSMSDLMERFDVQHIDLLKVDIEGAEVELFSSAETWIGAVDAIVAEMHDRFRDGCSRAFYDATTAFEKERRVGDVVHAVRRDPSARIS
jgi:FkbM family methyltransferase